MGKIQKMVWPQGKNLKPQPKGRAPVQPIPGPKPRKALAEKRRPEEYHLALPMGKSPVQALLADPYLQSWMAAMLLGPERTDNRPSCTVADPASTGGSMPELKEVLQLLAQTPAPSREPIEVTEAQYQALATLPMAETPWELATLASIYGTAVMVVKAAPAPLEGEILPPAPETEATDPVTRAMRNLSERVRQMNQEMMMAAIWGMKVP